VCHDAVRSVVDQLRELERFDRADDAAAAEVGPLRLGPAGTVVPELVGVDGVTRLATSPQVREFHGCARWWEHCSIALRTPA
jgi:hypothetical protein